MKSPFPGLDAYIEVGGLWGGFHNRLIHKIDEALAQILPQGYIIDTAVRSYIVMLESEGKTEHLAKPDVAVTEAADKKKPRKKKGGVAVGEPPEAAEALRMRAFVAEKSEETFCQVYSERDAPIL